MFPAFVLSVCLKWCLLIPNVVALTAELFINKCPRLISLRLHSCWSKAVYAALSVSKIHDMSNRVVFKMFLFSSDSARFPPVFRKPQALVHSFFYIGSTGRESSPPPARLSRITDSPAHISNSSLVQRAQRHTSALSPVRIWSSFWHIIRARRNTSALSGRNFTLGCWIYR